SPQPSPQRKSDISDFRLVDECPKSGRPDFGWGEGADRARLKRILNHLGGRAPWFGRLRIALTSLFALTALVGTASAQQRPSQFEIWDIKLGTPVDKLPDEFTDYACGTGGGPPSIQLTGWKDFRRCRPEPGGLREVYFRYDDELEYWAKANNF